jgi:hypothetical protein
MQMPSGNPGFEADERGGAPLFESRNLSWDRCYDFLNNFAKMASFVR